MLFSQLLPALLPALALAAPHTHDAGVAAPSEQDLHVAHGAHGSAAGLSRPVKHEVTKGNKGASVQLPETSPITLTSDKGPVKAYNRGLFVNDNKKTGSVCNTNLTDTCAPYQSKFTWLTLAYAPKTWPKGLLSTASAGPSMYNGTLKLDVAVPGGQALYADKTTGHIRYSGPHGTGAEGPQDGYVNASLSGGSSTQLINESPFGKFPGFWWLCPTGVSGEWALSIKDSQDGNFCKSTAIQFRYTFANELAGAFIYS